MYASDFRADARRALSGNWVLAVVAGLIASILFSSSGSGPSFKINFDSSSGIQPGIDLGNLPAPVQAWIAGSVVLVIVVSLVMGLLYFTIGGVVNLGYARFNLDLIDNGSTDLNHLFAYFSWFKTAFCARFLTSLYTFLWTLLLIIPGIVASYSYAMTPYILAEHPELTASEAIQRSKAMMRGNRWRLFCLNLSFLGWAILCVFTLGIGNLFLTPYAEAACASFYRSLTVGAAPSNMPEGLEL